MKKNWLLNLRRRSIIFSLALAGAALPIVSAYAETFPSKPITLISPYANGSVTDAMARGLAEAVSEELGQPVILMNKPGAGGVIGSAQAARAAPDGYTVLLAGSGSLMVATALRKTPPYDALESFTPLAATIDYASFLFVSPNLPVKNMKEFVDYVKKNPGKVAYAAPHNQSLLQMADLARRYDLDMVRVEYKSESAASIGLATNRVQAMFSTSSPLEMAKDGKLKVLATAMSKRLSITPDVPTLTESGTPAAPFGGGFLAIYGPANIPKPIAQKLSKAFHDALIAPKTKKILDTGGLVYNPIVSPEELIRFNREQRDLYIKLIDEIGLPKQ